jgi:uncharacterized membrane protein HdeD (DUF308 family)
MKKIAGSFRNDKYVRLFIPLGIIGILCGAYFLEDGKSELLRAVMPIGFSYLLCGTFRMFVTLFNREAPFVRFRLATGLLALYGLLVYGIDHFMSAYVPYRFANPVCQVMALICAALALQVLINQPSKNIHLERVSA